ncbi:hypothetical protein PENSPDRAFT_752701 [Peniophora sp. CONT]|nr:hypothetical protein PENSPDRAFT_752701 [Peniophora sp. CONT]
MNAAPLATTTARWQALPAEFIRTLLYLVAEMEQPARRSWNKPASLGWIRLSHVCRSWRTVALRDVPVLWARHATIFPSALDTCIERAHNEPLVIEFTDARGEYRDRLVSLLPMACGLRDEEVSRAPDEPHWATTLQGCPIPLLVELTIMRPDLTDGRVSVSIKSSLLAPLLRHCTLGSFMPIKAPSLQSLDLSGGNYPFIRLPDLLKVLRGMRSLVSLRLHRKPTEPDDAASQAKPAQLSNLKYFHIEGSTATQALRYLSSIITSSGVTLIAEIHAPKPALWKKLLESRTVMSSRTVAPDTLILRHAYDDPDNISMDHAGFTSLPYNVTLTSQWSHSALSSSTPMSGLTLGIEVADDDEGRPHARKILSAFQPLVSTYVRRLCIVRPDVALGIDDDTTYKADREKFRSVFRPWSNLRALCLIKAGRGVLRALRIRDEDSKSDVLLPSLRELELEVDGHREPDYWWIELGVMLQSRTAVGFPLERFILLGRKCPKEAKEHWHPMNTLVDDLKSTGRSEFRVPCTEVFVDERKLCLKHAA